MQIKKILIPLVIFVVVAGVGFFIYRGSDKSSSSPTSADQGQNQTPTNVGDTMTIETSYGKIEIELFSREAPKTVARIKELAEKGFYDGLSFHRVVPGFVVQGGDPRGDGTGGSGQNLPAEFNAKPHVEGSVAMARAADPNSADSQFYICLAPQPYLDGKYTVFGQVTKGMDSVKQIKVGDKMTKVSVK
jgi:cyclophilin family peptidyl-prolyl cis-trans isomerase